MSNTVKFLSEGVHVSLCKFDLEYETALVFYDTVAFVLAGNHFGQFCQCQTIEEAVDYFIENIGCAKICSDHRIITGIEEDYWDLSEVAHELLSEATIARIRTAEENLSAILDQHSTGETR